jgi:hypothetical protein
MLAVVPPIVDPTTSLWVSPWVDEVTRETGHDPRSAYVERFWLGILGPSATWLLRSISYGFDTSPEGFDLAPGEMARVLGLGDRTGRHSPFLRSMSRLCQFELAHHRGGGLVVRPMVPWIEPRVVSRMPEQLQCEHALWDVADEESSPYRAMRRRASLVAMSVVRTGGTVRDAERTLGRTGCHPSMVENLAQWAWDQHELGALHAGKRTPA